jgi:hypothetical protein
MVINPPIKAAMNLNNLFKSDTLAATNQLEGLIAQLKRHLAS